MKFTVDPVWPLPWVILAIAGLLALVLWTYPQRVRHLRAWDRRLNRRLVQHQLVTRLQRNIRFAPIKNPLEITLH